MSSQSIFLYDNDGASVYIVLLHSILHAVPVAVGKLYSSVQKSPANTVTARYRSVVNQGVLNTADIVCVCLVNIVPCDDFSILEVYDLSVIVP